MVLKHKGAFVVLNEKGLHTRPSTELVKCAGTFVANINLTYQDLTVNAKSILGILMLAASKNAKIYVEAEGPDAKEAVESLLVLAQNKFNVKY